MAVSVFPVAAVGSSSSSAGVATTVTVPDNVQYYNAIASFGAGVYTISCINATTAVVEFLNGPTTSILTATTASNGTIQTVSVNLATAADRVKIYINTGTNVIVSILQTGTTVSTTYSGTLDTITSSGTYNQTGDMFVAVVGGGGGGGNGQGRGGGGGSGGVYFQRQTNNAPVNVTIGGVGNGGGPGTVNNSQFGNNNSGYGGNSGGATTFGNLTSNGGGGGGGYSSNQGFGVVDAGAGEAGTPGGGKGGGRNSSVQASTLNTIPWGSLGGVGTVYTSGGGGYNSGSGPVGNIGGGGGDAAAGNGYGSGGGGASGSNTVGGSGRPGVVYVLRGVYS